VGKKKKIIKLGVQGRCNTRGGKLLSMKKNKIGEVTFKQWGESLVTKTGVERKQSAEGNGGTNLGADGEKIKTN